MVGLVVAERHQDHASAQRQVVGHQHVDIGLLDQHLATARTTDGRRTLELDFAEEADALVRLAAQHHLEGLGIDD